MYRYIPSLPEIRDRLRVPEVTADGRKKCQPHKRIIFSEWQYQSISMYLIYKPRNHLQHTKNQQSPPSSHRIFVEFLPIFDKLSEKTVAKNLLGFPELSFALWWEVEIQVRIKVDGWYDENEIDFQNLA